MTPEERRAKLLGIEPPAAPVVEEEPPPVASKRDRLLGVVAAPKPVVEAVAKPAPKPVAAPVVAPAEKPVVAAAPPSPVVVVKKPGKPKAPRDGEQPAMPWGYYKQIDTGATPEDAQAYVDLLPTFGTPVDSPEYLSSVPSITGVQPADKEEQPLAPSDMAEISRRASARDFPNKGPADVALPAPSEEEIAAETEHLPPLAASAAARAPAAALIRELYGKQIEATKNAVFPEPETLVARAANSADIRARFAEVVNKSGIKGILSIPEDATPDEIALSLRKGNDTDVAEYTRLKLSQARWALPDGQTELDPATVEKVKESALKDVAVLRTVGMWGPSALMPIDRDPTSLFDAASPTAEVIGVDMKGDPFVHTQSMPAYAMQAMIPIEFGITATGLPSAVLVGLFGPNPEHEQPNYVEEYGQIAGVTLPFSAPSIRERRGYMEAAYEADIEGGTERAYRAVAGALHIPEAITDVAAPFAGTVINANVKASAFALSLITPDVITSTAKVAKLLGVPFMFTRAEKVAKEGEKALVAAGELADGRAQVAALLEKGHAVTEAEAIEAIDKVAKQTKRAVAPLKQAAKDTIADGARVRTKAERAAVQAAERQEAKAAAKSKAPHLTEEEIEAALREEEAGRHLTDEEIAEALWRDEDEAAAAARGAGEEPATGGKVLFSEAGKQRIPLSAEAEEGAKYAHARVAELDPEGKSPAGAWRRVLDEMTTSRLDKMTERDKGIRAAARGEAWTRAMKGKGAAVAHAPEPAVQFPELRAAADGALAEWSASLKKVVAEGGDPWAWDAHTKFPHLGEAAVKMDTAANDLRVALAEGAAAAKGKGAAGDKVLFSGAGEGGEKGGREIFSMAAPPRRPALPEPSEATMGQWRERMLARIRTPGAESSDAMRAFLDAHPEVAEWQQYRSVAADAELAAAKVAEAPRALTKAENKARWFDGSTVTKTGEAGGAPLIVEHETSAPFTEFRAGEFGFHFGTGIPAGMFGTRRMRGLLKIENPLRMGDLGVWTPEAVLRAGPFSPEEQSRLLAEVLRIRKEVNAPTDEMIKAARASGDVAEADRWQAILDDASDAATFNDRRGNYLASKPVHDALRAEGYDGIVYANKAEGANDSFIALESQQFKSNRNVGTYGPNNPSILHSMADGGGAPAFEPGEAAAAFEKVTGRAPRKTWDEIITDRDVDGALEQLRIGNEALGPERAAHVRRKVQRALDKIEMLEADAARALDHAADGGKQAEFDVAAAKRARVKDAREALRTTLENESRKAKATPPFVSTRTGTDAVKARLSAAKAFDGVHPDDARDAERLLEMLGHPVEGGAFKMARRLNKADTALGSYNFGNDVLSIAERAFRDGVSTRTLAHEIAHRVSAWLPKEKAAALLRQYVKERRAAMKASPEWFGTGGKLVSKEPDAYRWTDMDEWFAERFADHAHKRLGQWDESTRSIMDAARFLLEKVRARIVEFFGVDAVPGVVEDLMAGKIERVIADAREPLRDRLIKVTDVSGHGNVARGGALQQVRYSKAAEEGAEAAAHAPTKKPTVQYSETPMRGSLEGAEEGEKLARVDRSTSQYAALGLEEGLHRVATLAKSHGADPAKLTPHQALSYAERLLDSAATTAKELAIGAHEELVGERSKGSVAALVEALADSPPTAASKDLVAAVNTADAARRTLTGPALIKAVKAITPRINKAVIKVVEEGVDVTAAQRVAFRDAAVMQLESTLIGKNTLPRAEAAIDKVLAGAPMDKITPQMLGDVDAAMRVHGVEAAESVRRGAPLRAAASSLLLGESASRYRAVKESPEGMKRAWGIALNAARWMFTGSNEMAPWAKEGLSKAARDWTLGAERHLDAIASDVGRLDGVDDAAAYLRGMPPGVGRGFVSDGMDRYDVFVNLVDVKRPDVDAYLDALRSALRTPRSITDTAKEAKAAIKAVGAEVRAGTTTVAEGVSAVRTRISRVGIVGRPEQQGAYFPFFRDVEKIIEKAREGMMSPAELIERLHNTAKPITRDGEIPEAWLKITTGWIAAHAENLVLLNRGFGDGIVFTEQDTRAILALADGTFDIATLRALDPAGVTERALASRRMVGAGALEGESVSVGSSTMQVAGKAAVAGARRNDRAAELVGLYDRMMTEQIYVPRMVREKMAAAIDRAFKPQSSSVLKSMVGAWKLTNTRGMLVNKAGYMLNNIPGDTEQIMIATGMRQALKTAIRSEGSSIVAIVRSGLPAIAGALARESMGVTAGLAVKTGAGVVADFGLGLFLSVTAGKNKGAIARLIHAGGNVGEKLAGKVANMLGMSAFRVEVSTIMDGSEDVVAIGDKGWKGSELRRIAIETGVYDSFDRAELAQSVGALGKWFRMPAEGVNSVAETVSLRKRLGLYTTLIEEGMQPKQAGIATVEALFDYRAILSDAEQTWLRQVLLPFWSWQKSMNRMVLSSVASPMGAYRIKMTHQLGEASKKWAEEAPSADGDDVGILNAFMLKDELPHYERFKAFREAADKINPKVKPKDWNAIILRTNPSVPETMQWMRDPTIDKSLWLEPEDLYVIRDHLAPWFTPEMHKRYLRERAQVRMGHPIIRSEDPAKPGVPDKDVAWHAVAPHSGLEGSLDWFSMVTGGTLAAGALAFKTVGLPGNWLSYSTVGEQLEPILDPKRAVALGSLIAVLDPHGRSPQRVAQVLPRVRDALQQEAAKFLLQSGVGDGTYGDANPAVMVTDKNGILSYTVSPELAAIIGSWPVLSDINREALTYEGTKGESYEVDWARVIFQAFGFSTPTVSNMGGMQESYDREAWLKKDLPKLKVSRNADGTETIGSGEDDAP